MSKQGRHKPALANLLTSLVRLCAGDMTSKEVVNRLADGGRAWAMVLVEQTWVFWLEDNLEDLEVGARCCENSRRQRCYWTGWVGYT